ncbi:MAG TPA: hypothetical protein VLV31_04260 [Candidatus Acidoferrales bacterium]|nr:hypothetical protein [Candidatus Acidoferrales bacterium]
MPFEFHENMVIWKKEASWDGFGFLGESRHGKTSLSFAFASLLFKSGVEQIRVLDDCFKLERERVRQCREWGSRGQLGELYYSELAKALATSGRSIKEIEPGDHTYQLHNVGLCLLLTANTDSTPRMDRCGREEFVDKLMPSNPFVWDYPKPGKNVVLQRLKENWRYFTLRTQAKVNKELIDLMAREVYEESQRLET